MSQVPFPGHGQGGGEPQPGSGVGNGTPGTDRNLGSYGIPSISGTPDNVTGTPDRSRNRARNGSRDGNGSRDARHDSPDGGSASPDAGDNFDQDAGLDRLIAGVEAGRIQVPPAGPIVEGLTVTLAEVTGPDAAGLAGLDVAGFAQGGAADTMAPGTALTALAGAACEDLDHLDDNQVLGLAAAGKRIAALGAWIELSAAGEFAGRRVSGDKPGTAAGENLTEFAGDELAPELGMTPFAAAQHLGYARDVTRRLPVTFAALRAGRVDGYRVKIVAEATQWLSDEDAAEADRVLAVSAAELTYGRLRNAAARLVLMLDPETARRRKDEAASNARVSCFREDAGTAGLSGRDLPSAGTLASWSHVKARALAYRAAGMTGTIDALRARAFLDLLQEHDSRHAPGAGAGDGDAGSAAGGGTDQPGRDDAGAGADAAGAGDHAGPDQGAGRRDEPGGEDGTGDGAPGCDGSPGGDGGGGTGPRPVPGGQAGPGGAARPPAPAPVAALINVTVPLGTLAGTSGTPGEVAGFGLMDAPSIRDLAAIASQHPATRWCVTVTGPDGTAAAHGCAPGRHADDPDQYPAGGRSGGNRDGPARNRDRSARSRAGPPASGDGQQAADFLRRLKVQLAPIAKGTCDHAGYEPGYRPSRRLRHLIGARTARCHFSGCSQPAVDCDADHTVPWPAGPTCQCNLGPPCRHHHRCKQDPGWKLTQPEPGVMTWTGPSGRQHTTRPTIYPV